MSGSSVLPIAPKDGFIGCEGCVSSSIISPGDDMGHGSPPSFLFGPTAQIDVSTGGLGVEKPCLMTCCSRSVFVAIKFGIKASSVLATAVFSLAFVAGCNTEEGAPEGGAAPKVAPSANAPGKAPEIKSAPAPAPPVTPPKEDTKAKP
jgi:hypothetical protein